MKQIDLIKKVALEEGNHSKGFSMLLDEYNKTLREYIELQKKHIEILTKYK